MFSRHFWVFLWGLSDCLAAFKQGSHGLHMNSWTLSPFGTGRENRRKFKNARPGHVLSCPFHHTAFRVLALLYHSYSHASSFPLCFPVHPCVFLCVCVYICGVSVELFPWLSWLHADYTCLSSSSSSCSISTPALHSLFTRLFQLQW